MQLASTAMAVAISIQSITAATTTAEKRAAITAALKQSPMIAASYTALDAKGQKAFNAALGKIVDGVVGVLDLTIWKQ